MDLRRAPRTVIDPKVRQVGFITPETSYATNPPPTPFSSSPPTTSLSPVMIPPPRHDPNSGLSPLTRGSYDPSDFSDELRTSTMNRIRRDGGGGGPSKVVATSLPGRRSGEMMMSTVKDAPKRDATMTLSGLPETKKGALLEMQNEGVESSRSQKPKPSKAERRAIQEAQRAAKEAGDGIKPASSSATNVPGTSRQVRAVKTPSQKKDGYQVTIPTASSEKVVDRLPEKDRKKDVPHPRMQFDDVHRVEKAKRRAVVNQSEAQNRVELFRHLPQYVHGTQLPDLESKFFQLDSIHPSVYKVGLQYLSGDISGGNARCIAMLLAFRDAIIDYSTPPEKILVRDLTAKISSYVSFLIECRPLSISMGNAIRFLKNTIAKLPHTLSEPEAKSSLQYDIARFISEKIVIADKVIVRHAVTKIRDGDVLLTYGSSSIVEMVLLYAHELGKQFRVVIVDSRPKLEGQVLLHRLVAKGLNCTYTHINAISYIMHEATRVFLGASSVLSNGTVYSRVGTACVAMVAHAFRVPVVVCCEAYKFHERVQLDSICSNELGDPDIIPKVPGRKDLNHLKDWASNENLQLLNLTYDATPADYVSIIITDYGMLPPTSVPVIVREYSREQLWI
ncbi:uncharacterized protein [Typha angustifolia]|uniref:uncharacterized protein isoform X1 n=2 Tax=Typha angustifolia TaxID=59011 RepID=UPI003C305FA5